MYTNLAGYKFVKLTDPSSLRSLFLTQWKNLEIKGTILLSEEGININIAGLKEHTTSFKNDLLAFDPFADITFHETYSHFIPFKRFKIKLKKEIITLRQPKVDTTAKRAPHISPECFKQWLDEKRDITVLDTRNDYEVRFGTFRGAVNLHLDDFQQFPSTLQNIDHTKPIVMFCTGGIRCEKAALYMLEQGFSDVYQLDGGILGYFAKVGAEHYDGECFIFDERIALDAQLNYTDTAQCSKCSQPIPQSHQSVHTESCSACE